MTMPSLSPLRTAAAALCLIATTAFADPPAPNPVHMNQLGFLPAGAKRAMVADPSTAPLAWRLLDGAGRTVRSGRTEVFGDDPASGEHVHRIELGDYATPGAGYKIEVAGKSSRAFAIDAGLYDRLRMDSLN